MAATSIASTRDVVASLDNDSCPYCETGALEPGRYEDDPAVVCEDCETPVVRL